MQKLLIATKNPGKLHEIRKFLDNIPLEIVSLDDLKIDEGIEEDGKNYLENAEKKAKFYAKLSGLPTIADDGGIEIDYLNGAPGIKSRRYFGKNGKEATDEEIIRKMSKIAEKIPKGNRGARFIVYETLSMPNGKTWTANDKVEGIIASEPRAYMVKGYPYRSFFYLPKLKKFYRENELSSEELKQYNHRYKAIQKLIPIIKKKILNA